MKDIEITIATAKDFKYIQALFRKMFDIFSDEQDPNYPFSKQGIKYLNDRIQNGFAFVAKKNHKVIGFLTGSVENAIEFKTYEKYGFIQNLYIEDAFRNIGIGRLLVHVFIEKCKNLNVLHIQTDSDANQELINFFTGIGFKICGVNYSMEIQTKK